MNDEKSDSVTVDGDKKQVIVFLEDDDIKPSAYECFKAAIPDKAGEAPRAVKFNTSRLSQNFGEIGEHYFEFLKIAFERGINIFIFDGCALSREAGKFLAELAEKNPEAMHEIHFVAQPSDFEDNEDLDAYFADMGNDLAQIVRRSTNLHTIVVGKANSREYHECLGDDFAEAVVESKSLKIVRFLNMPVTAELVRRLVHDSALTELDAYMSPYEVAEPYVFIDVLNSTQLESLSVTVRGIKESAIEKSAKSGEEKSDSSGAKLKALSIDFFGNEDAFKYEALKLLCAWLTKTPQLPLRQLEIGEFPPNADAYALLMNALSAQRALSSVSLIVDRISSIEEAMLSQIADSLKKTRRIIHFELSDCFGKRVSSLLLDETLKRNREYQASWKQMAVLVGSYRANAEHYFKDSIGDVITKVLELAKEDAKTDSKDALDLSIWKKGRRTLGFFDLAYFKSQLVNRQEDECMVESLDVAEQHAEQGNECKENMGNAEQGAKRGTKRKF